MTSSATTSGRLPTILLVDDDDGDTMAIERVFKKFNIGCTFVRASDGIEALEILTGANGRTELRPPWILLVDLNMPRMNGIQLLKAIRENENLRRSVIFVFTTSNRDEDKMAAYDLNVAGYITKGKAAKDILNLVHLVEYYGSIVGLPS